MTVAAGKIIIVVARSNEVAAATALCIKEEQPPSSHPRGSSWISAGEGCDGGTQHVGGRGCYQMRMGHSEEL